MLPIECNPTSGGFQSISAGHEDGSLIKMDSEKITPEVLCYWKKRVMPNNVYLDNAALPLGKVKTARHERIGIG